MEKNYKIEQQPSREITLTPNLEAEYSLIWLHGLGDSAEGFLPLFLSDLTPVPETFKIRLLTAPASPVTINNGMVCNSWYDIINFDRNPDSINFEDAQKNSAQVQKAIEEEVNFFGGDASKVLIGGFSQGCAMALHNGLESEFKGLGGIVGLSGYLFHKTTLPEGNPPTLLCHGEDDPMIDMNYARKSYERDGFLSRGNVEFNPIPMLDHGVNPHVLQMAKKFVKKVILKK